MISCPLASIVYGKIDLCESWTLMADCNVSMSQEGPVRASVSAILLYADVENSMLGDIAQRILDHAKDRHYDRETHVEMLDINPEMLEEGRKRFIRTMYHNGSLTD